MTNLKEVFTEEQLDADWKRRCQKWWDSKTAAEKAEWFEDKPHIPYIAKSKDGYWGRGDTQTEAIRQMRDAGFRGKTAGKVAVFVMPPSLLGGHIDYMGAVSYFHHPETSFRTDKPQQVVL